MKISVALCTYNGAQHLSLQLESILNQMTPVHEMIICDDGSQDDTISIINSFQILHPGIIQLHQNEDNLGAKKNFEKALSLSTGDLIFLSDQDDIWLPHKVSATIDFFERNPAATVVFSNGNIINNQGEPIPSTIWESLGFSQKLRDDIGPSKIFELLIRINNMVTGAALCLRKEACSYLLPFYCPHHYWHDYWIALAAACKNGLYFLEDELILYRLHNNQQAGLPQLNDHTIRQNQIKEMLWFGHYDKMYTERFLYYNLGSKKRIDLFTPRLARLLPDLKRIEKLNALLVTELEIIKRHLFAEMSFISKKKLALIAILGRQKTLNINHNDIFKLIFS